VVLNILSSSTISQFNSSFKYKFFSTVRKFEVRPFFDPK
jgi:hypothetical protein